METENVPEMGLLGAIIGIVLVLTLQGCAFRHDHHADYRRGNHAKERDESDVRLAIHIKGEGKMSIVLTTLKQWGVRLWFAAIIAIFFVGAWDSFNIVKAALKMQHWELAFVPHE